MKRCWIAGWVLCLSLATSYSQTNNVWTGTTSSDWNDESNWSLGVVPDAQFTSPIENAVVSTVTTNIATITADILYTPNDIIVNSGGRIDQLAGVAGTFGGAWMKVDNGIYNLANTDIPGQGITGYAQGSGSLNATGNLLIAAFGDNRTATMNINTDGTLAVSGELFLGDSRGSQATLNLEAGSLTLSNTITIGNNRGLGSLKMTSGTITKTGGGQLLVGQNNGIGRVLHSGGTISANNEVYIGNANAGSGSYTLNGTGSLSISNELVVGRELGTGVLNVDGGTITTEGNGNMYVGRRNGVGTLNQTAGTLNVNREFGVGTRDGNQGGIGTYNLGGGALAATNNIFVGKDESSSVNATSLVRGVAYIITTPGDTIWTGFGAADDNVGTVFTASASGATNSGTGVAVKVTDVSGKSSGTMTMAGGTVTGSDKLIIGENGATGFLAQSAGTMNVQNEIYIGNGLPPAQGTRILSNANDGQLEKRSEWALGTVTVQDTVNWNVNVGEWYGSGLNTVVLPFQLPNFGAVANPFASATFGVNLYSKGGATVTDLDLYAVRVSASPQIATTDWYNGSAPDPNATLIQASFLTPASTTDRLSGPNNLTDAAGSAALRAYLNSAYNGGAGAGKFVILRVSYGSDTFPTGWDAYNFTTRNAALEGDAPVINFTSAVPPLPPAGTYTLSDAAVVNVGNEVIVGRDNGTGTLNLNGGTVTATKISGGSGSATVNFNGGVLKAKRDEPNLIEGLDSANIQSGGLKINSNGFSVSTGQLLTGTGGVEKLGAGQLTLLAPSTYAGTTTVTAGVLRVEKTGLNAIVNATENTLVAEFAAPTAPGAYRILPGPLAGAQTFSATGLGANQQATFDRATSTVTVTGELVTGSTFASLYPANSEATLGSNGLSNLMNYALGGVDESSIPALPQLTVGVNGLTLTGNVRTDDTGLTIRGETATSLSGPWTPVDLSATGAPSAVLNTTVKSFTVPIDPAEPKKFLRFHVTK